MSPGPPPPSPGSQTSPSTGAGHRSSSWQHPSSRNQLRGTDALADRDGGEMVWRRRRDSPTWQWRRQLYTADRISRPHLRRLTGHHQAALGRHRGHGDGAICSAAVTGVPPRPVYIGRERAISQKSKGERWTRGCIPCSGTKCPHRQGRPLTVCPRRYWPRGGGPGAHALRKLRQPRWRRWQSASLLSR